MSIIGPKNAAIGEPHSGSGSQCRSDERSSGRCSSMQFYPVGMCNGGLRVRQQAGALHHPARYAGSPGSTTGVDVRLERKRDHARFLDTMPMGWPRWAHQLFVHPRVADSAGELQRSAAPPSRAAVSAADLEHPTFDSAHPTRAGDAYVRACLEELETPLRSLDRRRTGGTSRRSEPARKYAPSIAGPTPLVMREHVRHSARAAVLPEAYLRLSPLVGRHERSARGGLRGELTGRDRISPLPV